MAEQQPEQQQPGSRLGDSMMFGLIEHTEKIEESMAETQRVLTQRIDDLGKLQNWAVQAAVDLQKRADAAIKNLEAERSRLQGTQMNLERNAVQAIHDAVRLQSGDIERQTVAAFAAPLQEMKQAAGFVRQSLKEVSWLLIGLMISLGVALGLMLGYWPMRSSLNNMQEQLNRIEQSGAAQQPPAQAATAPDVHASAHRAKRSRPHEERAIQNSSRKGAIVGFIESMKSAFTQQPSLRKLAEQGIPQAQFNLGLSYANGEGVPQDSVEAVKWYQRAADQGLAEAQYNLGVAFDEGNGVKQDLVHAMTWYRKAAEQHFPSAESNLGLCYLEGRGVKQDIREGLFWSRRAAEDGDAEGQITLGTAYKDGKWVEQNLEKAYEWYRKAAQQNHAQGQFVLALFYQLGMAVKQDFVQYAALTRMAAEQGHVEAQYSLGLAYSEGMGVSKDEGLAVTWYARAAEQMHGEAQLRYAFALATGKGAAPNMFTSYCWLCVATTRLSGKLQQQAKELLNDVGAELTKEERDQAEKQVRESIRTNG